MLVTRRRCIRCMLMAHRWHVDCASAVCWQHVDSMFTACRRHFCCALAAYWWNVGCASALCWHIGGMFVAH
uniref:Uncharacterized protein n=1 Tax=Ixodes ricinus TaxID=34613 RepID=A0A6B0TS51_IXORI